MKKYLSAILASSMLLSTLGTSLALETPEEIHSKTLSTFSDVPQTHWASSFVQSALDANLMGGIGDGTFSPEGLMSYGAFAVVMCNGAFQGETLPLDTDTHWSDSFLNLLLEGDFFTSGGTSVITQDNNWQDQGISRENVATVVARLAEFVGIAPSPDLSLLSHFTDVSHLSQSQQEDISIILALDVMKGTSETEFGSGNTFNRAAACVVIEKMLDLGFITAKEETSTENDSNDTPEENSNVSPEGNSFDTSTSYPESLEYYREYYASDFNATNEWGYTDIGMADQFIRGCTLAISMTEKLDETFCLMWKDGVVYTGTETEDKIMNQELLPLFGADPFPYMTMNSTFAQEYPFVLIIDREAATRVAYFYVPTSCHPLWADLLKVDYGQRLIEGQEPKDEEPYFKNLTPLLR